MTVPNISAQMVPFISARYILVYSAMIKTQRCIPNYGKIILHFDKSCVKIQAFLAKNYTQLW